MEGKVWCLDKSTLHTFHTSTENVAQERYFYDLPETDGSKIAEAPDELVQCVERIFSRMEDHLAPLLELAIPSAEQGGVPPSLIPALAPHISMLWHRTKEYRELLQAIITAHRQDLIAELMERNYPEVGPESYPRALPDPKAVAAAHLCQLLDETKIRGFASALEKNIWAIGVNQTSIPLYTSDNPVIRRSHHVSGTLPNLSPEGKGTEYLLPLSPRIVLLILERTHFADLARAHCGRIFLTEEAVRDYNQLQALRCYRHVFSAIDHFEDALQLYQNRPEARLLTRPRVAIHRTQSAPLKSQTVVRLLDD